jgi:2-oxoglutarate ferredoxin oxidoreductase subunit alpha
MNRIEAINDFVIKFANVNGSGSASANELFSKAVMRMGVPVSPRNIFPSNIQGMPTWYEARVCEKGYHGRRGGVDMMVAMNPQTWDADMWPRSNRAAICSTTAPGRSLNRVFARTFT